MPGNASLPVKLYKSLKTELHLLDYPVIFNNKLREIYIRGEAYLEVTHNAGWPFIVKTDHLDV